jgi:3-hydroxybutyryl-CoA dehydrogenase
MPDPGATVVGTGMMGPGIAAVFALGRMPTRLVSRTPEGENEGLLKANQLIQQLLTNGLVGPDQSELAKSQLTGSSDLEGSLKSSRWVVESIPETLELKQQFFQHLDNVADRHTVLASNTSGISITAIAAKARFPERILTTHFWNPPHLMPLVEVVMGRRTKESVALETVELLEMCGKTAVLVRKDRPGQLGNRLQHALIREAINVVQEGIASPEDVDLAVKTGFGLRLPVWGIFEHADAVGLDLVKAVQDYVLPDLNNQPQACALINQKVDNGELGSKTGRGFYDWSRQDMSAAKARRDAFLIQFLRERTKQNANSQL